MARVTGIGGFFFTAADPAALAQWYERHLGIVGVPTDEGQRPWQQEAGPTIIAPMPRPAEGEESEFFWRAGQTFALNLRVDDLDAIIDQLEAAGIEAAVDPTTYPFGRFASLRDPEGNPLQLWQPMTPQPPG